MDGHIESLQYDGIERSFAEEQSMENGLLVLAYKDARKGHTVYLFTNLPERERRLHVGTHRKAKTYMTDKQINLESPTSLTHYLLTITS
ncbi:hypothetical protein CMK14_06210 [Candidatus Poribacteria bacterium]|nr:hypothetical protein [Candidatus Poribacteria bacterium]